MQATARTGNVVSFEKPPRVHVIYLLPPGDWSRFEAGLLSMARRFRGRVRVIRADRLELGRTSSARVFVSSTVPSILVLREGEIVAHTVGALPMTEVKGILEGIMMAPEARPRMCRERDP